MKWYKRVWMNFLTREEVIVSRTQGGKEFRERTDKRVWRPIPWVVRSHLIIVLIVAGSVALSVLAFFKVWPDLFQRLGAVTLVAGFFFQFVAANQFKSMTEKEFFHLFLKVTDLRAQAIASQEIEDRKNRTERTADLGQSVDINRAFATIPKAHRSHRFLEAFLVILGTFQVTIGDWFVCSWDAKEISTC